MELRRSSEATPAADFIGNSVRFEGAGVEIHAASLHEQDHEVARPGSLTDSIVLFHVRACDLDRPVERSPDITCNALGICRRDGVLVVVREAAENQLCRAGSIGFPGSPDGIKRFKTRLGAGPFGGEHLFEYSVERGCNRDIRPEIRCQRKLFSSGFLDDLLHFIVRIDIRPAEPINRLLWITHDKKGARARSEFTPVLLIRLPPREVKDHFRLDGVGILKLVDKQTGKA